MSLIKIGQLLGALYVYYQNLRHATQQCVPFGFLIVFLFVVIFYTVVSFSYLHISVDHVILDCSNKSLISIIYVETEGTINTKDIDARGYL